jgi:hypothetical protein
MDDDLPITMEDPPITFEAVVGWIINALAGVGILALIVFIGFMLGYTQK